MNKRLNFYIFGDAGEYDCYNPSYVFSMDYASEIMYILSKGEAFSLTREEIAKALGEEESKINSVLHKLEIIKAIEVKEKAYKVNFPVFLEEDALKLEKYTAKFGEAIACKIIELKDSLYDKVYKLTSYKHYNCDRILYHIICDKIFDGTALDFFSEKKIFSISKMQPGNRDYIIVAYEDSKLIEEHSSKILCSSNNYESKGFIFNSFGDSAGARRDFFRFFRLTQKSMATATPFSNANITYNKILDNTNKKFVFECGKLMKSISERKAKTSELTPSERTVATMLKELSYIRIEDDYIFSNVPIFYESECTTIIDEISDIILKNILPIVEKGFEELEANTKALTPIKHKVDIKEIANELWHQIFGAANEYLVREGFVSKPPFIKGEGRYFRSLTINNEEND